MAPRAASTRDAPAPDDYVDPGSGLADDEPEPDDVEPDEPDDKPGRTAAPVSTGAGWLLGLLLWGWVLLPFVKGGPAAVKAVWMAKFLNKAPDGSPLP